jgi:hypothetical protein
LSGHDRKSDGRRRIEPATNPALGTREERHRRRRDSGKADANPACPWVIACDESADRLRPDVRGEHEEACGDELLRPAFGRLGDQPLTGE